MKGRWLFLRLVMLLGSGFQIFLLRGVGGNVPREGSGTKFESKPVT